jgi:hypothetical protein
MITTNKKLIYQISFFICTLTLSFSCKSQNISIIPHLCLALQKYKLPNIDGYLKTYELFSLDKQNDILLELLESILNIYFKLKNNEKNEIVNTFVYNVTPEELNHTLQKLKTNGNEKFPEKACAFFLSDYIMRKKNEDSLLKRNENGPYVTIVTKRIGRHFPGLIKTYGKPWEEIQRYIVENQSIATCHTSEYL